MTFNKRVIQKGAIRNEGDWVFYWMTTARRSYDNFALERAIQVATELSKPLLVLEGLNLGYPDANVRMHNFVVAGMRDNYERFAATPIFYYPYVEKKGKESRGLLRELSRRASLVVTDLPVGQAISRFLWATIERIDAPIEIVDSNGLMPLAHSNRIYNRAVDFRRYFQKSFAEFVDDGPSIDPLTKVNLPKLSKLPASLSSRWPETKIGELLDNKDAYQELSLDQGVGIVPQVGGSAAAHKCLRDFLALAYPSYGKGRNHPDEDATSRLSPYLHFGHISTWRVLREIAELEDWDRSAFENPARGSRAGWWGMSESAEAFLDQVIVWRELGYNFAHKNTHWDRFDTLPKWALESLYEHRRDRRPAIYSADQLDACETADEVWNAAQRQLLETGRMHNYLRMLWGKRVLEWMEDPAQAYNYLLTTNDRFALDGRDPNSVSGVSWCFGRFDRAWGPERPIYGKVRYMSSENTKRKLRLKQYLLDYSSSDEKGWLL